MIQKAYKYRIYPSPDQEIMINKTFGCCRFIYNYGLAKIKEAYEKDKTRINISEISKEIPLLKSQEKTSWLSEVPATALIHSLRNLDAAYKNFFRQIKKGEKAGYPKFKSKYDRNQSFKFHQGYNINIEEGYIDAPKLKGLKVLFHREFIGIPKTCTISKNPIGQYFISITVETVGEIPDKKPITTNDTVIIHLGVRNFAYIKKNNEITTIAHPKYLINSLDRIKILNKRLSHKKNTNTNRKKDEEFKGANIEKARIKLAKLHNKIKNQRAAFLHNLTADLIKKGNNSTILVENWDVSRMVKDKYLSKYISDSGWRSFWSMGEYKSEWNGLNFIQVNKDFPSSKICNECGSVNENLGLKINWTCGVCKTTHNREENALLNLEASLEAHVH